MPSSTWAFLGWEAKAPVPCEEQEPCRACTEVWVRTSPSPYEGNTDPQALLSTVSLPPASSRSLPVRQSARGSSHQHTRSSADQEAETPGPWCPSSMLQKVCAVLPFGSASSKAEHKQTASAEHFRNPSVDPKQISADDFISSLRDSNAAPSSFMIPSALCPSRHDSLRTEGSSVGWEDSVGTAIRPSTQGSAQGTCSNGRDAPVRLEYGFGMNHDTDSDDDTAEAWVAMPRREISANSLSRLEVSLRHALDSASIRTAPPTAGNARCHPSTNRQGRPSFTYP